MKKYSNYYKKLIAYKVSNFKKNVMKRDKKHLSFYKKCMSDKTIPFAGLCGCSTNRLLDRGLLDFMSPTSIDRVQLENEGLSRAFWGSGLNNSSGNRLIFEFTELRQTIVLFMAAINNEL